MVFSDCLISLKQVFEIHPHRGMNLNFILFYCWVLVHCMDILHFTHLSLDVASTCSLFVNNTAVDIYARFLCGWAFDFSWVESLDHMITPYLTF